MTLTLDHLPPHFPNCLPDIILCFDGVCNLCSGLVKWVLKQPTNHSIIYFTSLQSRVGAAFQALAQELSDPSLESVLLYHKGRLYTNSDAVLALMALLKRWSWLVPMARLMPSKWRDAIYTLVMDNRYRWFGKNDQCLVPTEALKSRFV